MASGAFFVTNSSATAQLIVGQSGSGTLTLTNTGNLTVNQLLVTNLTATTTNSLFTFPGTLTTSNATTAVAANIVLASNTTTTLNGNWNMQGGTNLVSPVVGNAGTLIVGNVATGVTVNIYSGAVWTNGVNKIFVGTGPTAAATPPAMPSTSSGVCGIWVAHSLLSAMAMAPAIWCWSMAAAW